MDHNYYNQISEGYEELHGEEQTNKLKIIVDLLSELGINLTNYKNLLDVGCGSGLTTRFWKDFGLILSGLDPAIKLLEKAKEFDPVSSYVLAEAENIPFNDDQFDIVTSITAIQNFQDMVVGIDEIWRVGKNFFVLSFLKRSNKKDIISKIIRNKFSVIKEFEESKDIIFICKK